MARLVDHTSLIAVQLCFARDPIGERQADELVLAIDLHTRERVEPGADEVRRDVRARFAFLTTGDED